MKVKFETERVISHRGTSVLPQETQRRKGPGRAKCWYSMAIRLYQALSDQKGSGVRPPNDGWRGGCCRWHGGSGCKPRAAAGPAVAGHSRRPLPSNPKVLDFFIFAGYWRTATMPDPSPPGFDATGGPSSGLADGSGFQPSILVGDVSWGVAPGWDGSGLWPLGRTQFKPIQSVSNDFKPIQSVFKKKMREPHGPS